VPDDRARVVFLVLDGMPAPVVCDDVTPMLDAWCTASGTTPHTVGAVLPATTYPNHATFVTGVAPAEHGIVGNHVLCDDGRFRPARKIGPVVPTIFDRVSAAGLTSTLVVGDQELVGVMGGTGAGSHWPPDGKVPAGAATDEHGYLHDDETLPVLLDAVASNVDLVVGQLNAPDTAGHVHGPTSHEAHAVYLDTDARLAAVRDAVDARDDGTVVMIVSDHAVETVEVAAPIDLTAALDGSGLTWFPEGSAALVYGEHADLDALLGGIDDLAGSTTVAPGIHVVWGEPGRWLCFDGIDAEPGMHGSPRTAVQLAAAVGTHPAVHDLDARIQRDGFDATSWAGEMARLLLP
jgi:hypothetical protein